MGVVVIYGRTARRTRPCGTALQERRTGLLEETGEGRHPFSKLCRMRWRVGRDEQRLSRALEGVARGVGERLAPPDGPANGEISYRTSGGTTDSTSPHNSGQSRTHTIHCRSSQGAHHAPSMEKLGVAEGLADLIRIRRPKGMIFRVARNGLARILIRFGRAF